MIYKITSPFGSISYAWDGKLCTQVWLNKHPEAVEGHDDPVSIWFKDYFDGKTTPLPELAEPNKPFQVKLRYELLKIPTGEVRTYGELSQQLGTSPRGLGQALGANPFPIMVPCHRIISASGLGGYAYDSTWKKKLLNFER